MSTLLILGAGMMGSALAVPLADRGHVVRLVGTHLDDAIVESLKTRHFHPKMKLELPASIEAYSHLELATAAQGIDAVAFGVSSAGIDWACAAIAPHVRASMPLFMITKGLVLKDHKIVSLPDAVKAKLPPSVRDTVHPAAIAGPCIAGELARRVPTCVVVAGREAGQNAQIARLIETPYYRPFPTTDVIGAEVGAALKNAYAMGIAFPAGMHEKKGGEVGSIAMHNLESAIMAQAVLEMQKIATLLGGRASSVSGMAGVGDLDVTTNGGRTGRFGKLLGTGLSLPDAIARMEGATLECLEILAAMRAAFQARAIPLPIDRFPLLEHLAAVALDGAPVDVPMTRFFADDLT